MDEGFVSSSGQVAPPPKHKKAGRKALALVPSGLRPKLRRMGLGLAQRSLGRGLSHLDYDWVVANGVLEMGPHTAHVRPIVRHTGKATTTKVVIGSFCNIGQDVEFLLGREHHIDWITANPLAGRYGVGPDEASQDFSKGNIVVGSDVWLGIRSLVLSGVNIGHGAVVGAGTVVPKDVRPYAVVVGNPAKEIRRRFPDEYVDALLRIRWWDWPFEKILSHADLLCSDRVEEFVTRFDPAG